MNADAPRNTILVGDVIDRLRELPDGCVQTCVTSPPYWNLRDYGVAGQIGLEPTPAAYVARMVEVFREVHRVLRDDGTAWVNLGDSYSGSSNGYAGDDAPSNAHSKSRSNRGARAKGRINSVGPNHTNCIDRLVKGQPLIFGNAATVGISAKRRDVAAHDEGAPDGVFLRLLGVERVTIKQRDNDFCQVLHTLHGDGYCRIAAPICFARRDATDLEMVIDTADDLSIIVTEHDADSKAILSVLRAARGRSRKHHEAALAVKETAKPVTEWIADGESIGQPITFDAPLKRFPDVYLVDEAVPLANRLHTAASDGCNFRVAHASEKQLTLTLGDSGVNLRAVDVSHLYAPNSYGSLVHYRELYDKANREARATGPKQELGIPEMVKRALMEDGWICRSTIIWSKPNPMPESVTDRPTRAHEYIFLLSKRARYYYDADAIREPMAPESAGRYAYAFGGAKNKHLKATDKPTAVVGIREVTAGRNKRSVWTVATHPFPDAHFATFPPKLIEPCILAGSSPQACEHCGAPWARVVSYETRFEGGSGRAGRTADEVNAAGKWRNGGTAGNRNLKLGPTITSIERGWRPTCRCEHNTGAGRCIVLDPFGGSGTTALVAQQWQRDWLLIELNPAYVEMAQRRLAVVPVRLFAGGSEVSA